MLVRYVICFAISSLLATLAVADLPLSYKFKKLPAEALIERLESDLTGKRLGPAFAENFHVFGNSAIEDAEIVFLPEYHYDVFSILAQVQVVAELSKPGDVVLAELAKEQDSEMVVDCQVFSIGKLNHVSGPGTPQYQKALVGSGKLIALWQANEIWPYSESMTCGGWDSLKLLKRHDTLIAGLKKSSSDAETKAFESQNEAWLLSQRKQILKEYGLKLSDLGLENPLKDRLGSIMALRIVSVYARNLHLIKTLEDKKPAPGSRVFVMAGAIHVPLPCELTEIQASPAISKRYCHGFEITLRPITDFLKGRKYVVLAHKAIFRGPSVAPDEL